MVQDDAEARMKAGEALVDLTALMTSTVASMVASWVGPMEASLVAPMASGGGLGCDGFDGGSDGFDGGSDGFESKQRRDNCKRRSRGSQGKMPEWETMPWINSGADCGFDGFDGGSDGSGGGFDGFDGLDSGVVGVAEADDRAKKRWKRGDGLIHKICEERADELTLKIDGERVERLTHKIRGERADVLTHKSCEERADELTYRKVVIQVLVDGDGSESGGFRWAKTGTTSCLRRTQKKCDSSRMLGCVRCEKTWLRMAQVTPSTEEHEGALRKWEKKKTWEGDDGVDGGGVDGFDGVDGCGLGGVEWWRR